MSVSETFVVCLCRGRKEFGLDSFISPTLLSNMREKDLRKAISYHLKKIQALLEPRQKVDQASPYLKQKGRRDGDTPLMG